MSRIKRSKYIYNTQNPIHIWRGDGKFGVFSHTDHLCWYCDTCRLIVSPVAIRYIASTNPFLLYYLECPQCGGQNTMKHYINLVSTFDKTMLLTKLVDEMYCGSSEHLDDISKLAMHHPLFKELSQDMKIRMSIAEGDNDKSAQV